MTQSGFFAQRRQSPGGLALVILLHAGVLSALIMIKSPAFERLTHPPTTVTLIDADHDPPPDPPPPPDRPQPQSRIDHVRTIIDTNRDSDVVVPSWTPPTPPETAGTGIVIAPPPLPPPAPVRHAAELDARFSDALQPPYPAAEQRAEHEGTVRVRVTIGADGRVKAVARLQATSDAFWAVTERQALTRWRFRPATVDGRPVEDSKVMTLRFRLIDL
jgi:protein TonB